MTDDSAQPIWTALTKSWCEKKQINPRRVTQRGWQSLACKSLLVGNVCWIIIKLIKLDTEMNDDFEDAILTIMTVQLRLGEPGWIFLDELMWIMHHNWVAADRLALNTSVACFSHRWLLQRAAGRLISMKLLYCDANHWTSIAELGPSHANLSG